MQHQRPMRIHHALRSSGRTRRVTHRRCVIFIHRWIFEFAAGRAQQRFVVFEIVLHCVTAVRHHKNSLEARFVSKTLQARQQRVVHNQKSVLGMIRNKRKLTGMQPQIKWCAAPRPRPALPSTLRDAYRDSTSASQLDRLFYSPARVNASASAIARL